MQAHSPYPYLTHHYTRTHHDSVKKELGAPQNRSSSNFFTWLGKRHLLFLSFISFPFFHTSLSHPKTHKIPRKFPKKKAKKNSLLNPQKPRKPFLPRKTTWKPSQSPGKSYHRKPFYWRKLWIWSERKKRNEEKEERGEEMKFEISSVVL